VYLPVSSFTELSFSITSNYLLNSRTGILATPQFSKDINFPFPFPPLLLSSASPPSPSYPLASKSFSPSLLSISSLPLTHLSYVSPPTPRTYRPQLYARASSPLLTTRHCGHIFGSVYLLLRFFGLFETWSSG
jgi:hypothetical protein